MTLSDQGSGVEQNKYKMDPGQLKLSKQFVILSIIFETNIWVKHFSVKKYWSTETDKKIRWNNNLGQIIRPENDFWTTKFKKHKLYII